MEDISKDTSWEAQKEKGLTLQEKEEIKLLIKIIFETILKA